MAKFRKAGSRTPRKLAAEQLFEYAVKCLGARAYSSGDLGAKLRLRAIDPSDAERAVERLKEIGYLDDRRFAESYATARVENDGFGRIRVLNDLRGKRVSGELAEKAVEQALGDKPEAELIDAFMQRRMGSIAAGGPIEDERKLAAAYRKLRRAGFNSGPILAALRGIAARPESIEEFPEDEEDV
ncbi:MAG: RecX family transcriptional regulator [Acidobacteriota bacterium]|nr:RecX family transcriptional regulator [Acidobacteriota bacterium]